MAWEVFAGGGLQFDEPGISISSLGRIHINKRAATRFLEEGVDFVELLFDRSRSRIAIRPSEKKSGAYRLNYGEKVNGVGFSCISFLNHIGYDWSQSRNFAGTWTNAHWLIMEVPANSLGHAPLRRSAQRGRSKNEKEISEEIS